VRVCVQLWCVCVASRLSAGELHGDWVELTVGGMDRLQCERGSRISREARFTRMSKRLTKEVKAESSGLPCVRAREVRRGGCVGATSPWFIKQPCNRCVRTWAESYRYTSVWRSCQRSSPAGGVEWSCVVFSIIKPRYRRVCTAVFVAGWPCLLFIFHL
jgi:hypothetical protein